MSRQRMSPGKDQRVFTRTARATRDINIRPAFYRGGYRL